jgi:hypothetical protein
MRVEFIGELEERVSCALCGEKVNEGWLPEPETDTEWKKLEKVKPVENWIICEDCLHGKFSKMFKFKAYCDGKRMKSCEF